MSKGKVVDQKEYKYLKDLKPWPQNPRIVKEEDYLRLKQQIEQLGMYKPLLIVSDGTILGGRTRYQVYKELGINPVWVHTVYPKTDEERLKYVLSDNDNVGLWVEQDLAELLTGFEDPALEFKDYKIDTGSVSIEDVLKSFGPSGEGNDGPEPKITTLITCPNCGHEFKKPRKKSSD